MIGTRTYTKLNNEAPGNCRCHNSYPSLKQAILLFKRRDDALRIAMNDDSSTGAIDKAWLELRVDVLAKDFQIFLCENEPHGMARIKTAHLRDYQNNQ